VPPGKARAAPAAAGRLLPPLAAMEARASSVCGGATLSRGRGGAAARRRCGGSAAGACSGRRPPRATRARPVLVLLGWPWRGGDLGGLAVVCTAAARPHSDGRGRQRQTSPEQEEEGGVGSVLGRLRVELAGDGGADGLGPDLGRLGLIWVGRALLIARFQGLS
jgi:hypothetical protein